MTLITLAVATLAAASVALWLYRRIVPAPGHGPSVRDERAADTAEPG